MIGWQEALPIVILIVVLFGAKRLPELGKSLGQGIREFKKSSKGLLDDTDDDEEEEDDKSTKSQADAAS